MFCARETVLGFVQSREEAVGWRLIMSMRGSAGPIRTTAKLATALGLPESYLRDIAARPDASRYSSVKAPAKRDGSPREVFSPSTDLRVIQGRIVERILKRPAVVRWPPYIFGGIHRKALAPGDRRDHVECASKHCGAKSILKMDISDFFGNVTKDIVVGMFTGHFGWESAPAKLLAELCTKGGSLPQGGITSSYLALMSLYDVEPRLVAIITSKKLVYTRYVDDITVSSKLSSYDFLPVMAMIEQALLTKGFSSNASKTSIARVGLESLQVHGLTVVNRSPALPRREVARVKSIARQAILDARESGRRSYGFRKRYYRSMGLVNKLARVRSGQHASLAGRLKSIKPLPNFDDYRIATGDSFYLREVFVSKRRTYWYFRRFNVLMSRLDLIGVENKSWANNLRSYMKNHFRPEYEERR